MAMKGKFAYKYSKTINLLLLFRDSDYFEKDGKRCVYDKIDKEIQKKLEGVCQFDGYKQINQQS